MSKFFIIHVFYNTTDITEHFLVMAPSSNDAVFKLRDVIGNNPYTSVEEITDKLNEPYFIYSVRCKR